MRLSRLKRQLGDAAGSRLALRRGVQAFPANGELWRKLAEMAKAQGDVEGARRHYAREVSGHPKPPAAFDAWARLEMGQGRRSRAAEIAKAGLSVVKEKEARSRLWHAYALALVDEGERLEALTAGVGEDSESAYLNHALGIELSKNESCRTVARTHLLKAAVAKQPEATLSLARLEEMEGRENEARLAYRAATAERSATIAAWRSWARFEESRGQLENARGVYREASVRFPRDAELHVQWARLEPRVDYARQVLHAGLRSSSAAEHPRLYHALGDLEATAARRTETKQLGPLHAARRAFYRGAKAANNRKDLVNLVHSWAYCEWAIAQRRGMSKAGMSRVRRLFAWASKLARDDLARLSFILVSRAGFEAAAGDFNAAKRFALFSVRQAESDHPTKAKAWTILSKLATSDSLKAKAANNARVHDYQALQAFDSTDPTRHALKRQWTKPPPPLEDRYGCFGD
ncbi:MAG: tetratricopeptide repeat protein [Planctomycetota bacterium]